jgi:Domain of unknown function (DUF4411)
VITSPLAFYSIDTSALIHGWRRAYRPKNFGFIGERLDAFIQDGRLRASIEVRRELEKKDDELLAWCKEERRDALFVEIDDECQRRVIGIMQNHPGLVDIAKGRSGADPFVIALAAAARPSMTVVTEENPGKQRIPDVCVGENIHCIKLADLMEDEDWQFT